jgi:signal transduction histidine kinase
MREPAGEIVASALATADPDAARGRLLDAVRVAFSAEHAILARTDPPTLFVRGAAPDTVMSEVRPSAARCAIEATGPVEVPLPDGSSMLAVPLRPTIGPWALGICRRGLAWTPEEHARLAACAPEATLVLEVACLRETIAAAETREREEQAERERFLGVLAHELRNPLAPILMWTGTLKRLRADDPQCLRATEGIERAVALERRLIDGLSDVSRLERGGLQLRTEPVNLGDVVGRAVEARRADLAEAGLSVISEPSPTAVPVEGDPGRLLQVVEQLLDNAIKFTPRDGTIGVGVARRGDQAELRVSDTGPGLADEVRSRRFAPFVRGPNARGGLGVGLAVTCGLVTLHGGTLEALPTGDLGGTTMVVTLPLLASWREERAGA